MSDNFNHKIIMKEGDEMATLVFHWECNEPNGHIFDGCRNFLRMGDDEIQAYICVLCGCHRDFHRRQTVQVLPENALEYLRLVDLTMNLNPPPHQIPPPFYVQNHNFFPYPNFLRAVYENREEGEIRGKVITKKEHRRTTLTLSQKEIMKGYADKLQWRLLGHDENKLHEFCHEIGVTPQVFKTWLRNNKNKLFRGVNAASDATTSCAGQSSHYRGGGDGNGDGGGDGNGGSNGGMVGGRG
ncbi:zinc-finger homeodomain protein 2-like [Impatiens glandulifera]|uniref:zinc-finger homeodomain protein 2-like n=1 Tax=Impatiens glandulifera TaxID=253017 RepID=UPI001FB0CA7A|nr:zinc-finger homeodomain protein 2-like [Impatiens glandulifera]